jgi:hypothetical protein
MEPSLNLPSIASCTPCRFKEDQSNYWTAVMYFKHENGRFIRVSTSSHKSPVFTLIPPGGIGSPQCKPLHWRPKGRNDCVLHPASHSREGHCLSQGMRYLPHWFPSEIDATRCSTDPALLLWCQCGIATPFQRRILPRRRRGTEIRHI